MAQPADPARPMRADARRNGELLIATARAVFTEKGAEAPLDEIARRAGVGAGTLYRHFPNREALIEAVYRDEVNQLANLAGDLLAAHSPAVALDEWMRAHVRFVAHRRGLATSLKAMLDPNGEAMVWCKATMLAAAEKMLDAGREAGTVRADLVPYDLLRLGHAIGIAAELGTAADSERMIQVMLVGLRA
ncbi:MAG TPA: helix-turn-helix domain-containing protein [Pseudonocardiaceae bacterium]|jgi:AcrR family transcriptional regulator